MMTKVAFSFSAIFGTKTFAKVQHFARGHQAGQHPRQRDQIPPQALRLWLRQPRRRRRDHALPRVKVRTFNWPIFYDFNDRTSKSNFMTVNCYYGGSTVVFVKTSLFLCHFHEFALSKPSL